MAATNNGTIIQSLSPSLTPTLQHDTTAAPTIPTTVVIAIIGIVLTFFTAVLAFVEWREKQRRGRRRHRRRHCRYTHYQMPLDDVLHTELSRMPCCAASHDHTTGTNTLSSCLHQQQQQTDNPSQTTAESPGLPLSTQTYCLRNTSLEKPASRMRRSIHSPP
jgi:hypothetical protein